MSLEPKDAVWLREKPLGSLMSQFLKLRADTLTLRATARRELGDLEVAIGDYSQAGDLFRSLDDEEGIQDVYNHMGLTYRYLGKWDDAIVCYKKSLAFSKQRGDRQQEARTLNNLGNVYRLKGRYSPAIDYSQRSLELSQGLSSPEGAVALTKNTLGQIYRDQREFDEAEKYLKEATAIFEKIEDRRFQGRSLANLGHVYQRRGRAWLGEAEALLHQSAQIAEAEGDTVGLSYALNKLGRVYRDWGEWEKAESHFLRALALAQEQSDWYRVQDNLTDLCALFAKSGTLEKMEPYVAKVREMEQKYDIWVGRLEVALGDAAWQRQNIAETFEHYARACRYLAEFDRTRYRDALEQAKMYLKSLAQTKRAEGTGILKQYWTEHGLDRQYPGLPEMCDRVDDISD